MGTFGDIEGVGKFGGIWANLGAFRDIGDTRDEREGPEMSPRLQNSSQIPPKFIAKPPKFVLLSPKFVPCPQNLSPCPQNLSPLSRSESQRFVFVRGSQRPRCRHLQKRHCHRLGTGTGTWGGGDRGEELSKKKQKKIGAKTSKKLTENGHKNGLK